MKKEVKIIIIIGIILLAYVVYVKNFSKATSELKGVSQLAKNKKINDFKEQYIAISRSFCSGQLDYVGVCNATVDGYINGMDWELLYDTYTSGDMSYFDSVNIGNYCCGQFYN